jgi:large subunit ribosomal protein L21e
MVKKIGTLRSGSRHKYSKSPRQKGKLSLTRYFQEFKVGDVVILKAEPAYQKGMYFHRFHGKTGIVKGKKGSCYDISIKDRNKEKTIIVHPIHLVKVQ